jgi:cobyrinic acid a,c-diamide synthase
MAGVFPKRAYKTEKLQRFGYISLISNEDNILVKKGERINAHEFHYWDTEENGRSFIAEKPFSNRQYECIIAEKNIFAGFPHLYFYGNIEFAKGFIKSAHEFHEKRIKNE